MNTATVETKKVDAYKVGAYAPEVPPCTFYVCKVAGVEVWNSTSEKSAIAVSDSINSGAKPVWGTVNGREVLQIWHGTGVKPQYFYKENPANVVSVSQELRKAEVASHLSRTLK